ncbi:hypothetical protein OFL77_27870, partial [Escherichia coli]|uniref:hypothetical protein n=1 Tax=Escherichia coli TaxID=562 RepID=UPI0021DFEF15
ITSISVDITSRGGSVTFSPATYSNINAFVQLNFGESTLLSATGDDSTLSSGVNAIPASLRPSLDAIHTCSGIALNGV